MYSKMFSLHARLLKAIAHPRRLEIIHLLRDQELPVTDIHTMLDLPQANISQHLMILRENDVVQTRKDGKQVFYSISNPKIIESSDLLREVLIEKYTTNGDTALADSFTVGMKELVPLVHDPVCEMRVSPKTAGFHCMHNGADYYFCASGCLKKFKIDPKKYLE